MEQTSDQHAVQILQREGYKTVKDTPDYMILERGSEQVMIEGRDIDLCNPFVGRPHF